MSDSKPIKTWRNPLRKCACCLYGTGLGNRRIGSIMCRDHSVIAKWIRKAGVKEQGRESKQDQNKLRAIRASKPVKVVKPKRVPMTVEQIRDRARLKYFANLELNRQRSRQNARAQWRKQRTNPEWIKKRRAMHRQWSAKNKEHKIIWDRQWRKSNPDKMRAFRRKQRINPKYRLKSNLCKRMREFMKRGLHKQSATKLIGCSRQHLMQWIEKRFTKGMAWNNYGEWHVDHIIPCASFDLSKPEQQRMCFHYTNLRPLWAAENMAKSDTIITAQPELTLPL